MKRLSRRSKVIALTLTLLILGAFFRWETKKIVEADTGKLITQREGIAFPWQLCGPRTYHGTTRINFHVRQWLCYGLIRLEATGQTTAHI
ncbi:MAG TPA: hypothetical protein VGH19_08350 [Verrucomicrobiae bacterium]